jgi:lysozyme
MAIEILRRRPPSELYPSKAALDLIRHFEGLSLTGYLDPIGIPTIGYGRTGPVAVVGKRITLAEADALLDEDVARHAQIVRDQITVPLTQGEFDALASLVFNLGYIPKSLKACLNGGVTDAGKVMTPGSYGSALLQFPRNCRAGGKPLKGLYRRRLAEACLFCDLPWENACSISVVQLSVDEAGKIDTNESTSLEDTLMRARLDTSRPPDTSHILKKQWSELVKPEPVKAEPEAVPAPGDAEPAEKEAPQPNPPPLVSAPVPAQPSGPAVAGPAVEAGVSQPPPPVSKGPPKVEPKPPRLPDPPVPIGQQTGAVDAARKSEEWSSSAKSMIYSRRFWGLLLVVAGRVWMLKTGSNAVLGAVSDPLVMEMFSGFMVMVIGEAVQHWGERKATRPLK